IGGSVEMQFPFFRVKAAPVSGVESRLDYEVCWLGEQSAEGRYSFRVKVSVPVTSLCPCSKEISDYGAHNQRSLLTIRVEVAQPDTAPIEWHELVRFAEDAASSELWPMLKRADEKW